VADRTRVAIARSRYTADAWLSKVRRRSRVTPRTRIKSATGRSTSATDVRDDTIKSSALEFDSKSNVVGGL